MIQRIQSIFLALASGTFFGQFGLAFATSTQSESGFFKDLVYNIHDHVGLLVVTLLGAIASLGAIFLYNNRPLQLRIAYLGIVLAVVLPALALLLFFSSGYKLDATTDVNDSLGIYLPIVSVVLLALAARFINKDEKLVRSSDRLR